MPTDILPIAGPATHLPPPPGGRWTVADYEQLPDDGQRYELINGDLRMAPAPTPDHQAASLRLAHYLFTFIETAGHGRVFTAPIDVQLGPATIVQPDLIVILHGGAASITAQRIVGPPDLVVEVVSPATASYDRREKRDLYAAAGVREYWIADPGYRFVELLTLAGSLYRAEHVYRGQAVIPSTIIPGWNVATERLFG
ncbi:MAG: Uma2 family endonuclease [Chloroflexaceae bacterium]|nr:Uma2 family endonuclease [Chloroflexaceae bacterium]